MVEEAKVTFYRIPRCGYYRGNRKNPEFGGVADTLEQFMGWVKSDGRSLADTSTYEIEEASNLLKTYCLNLTKHASNGDYLLTTWNETPTNKGRVASVQANKPVGQAGVVFNDIVANTIPGYATYFWFIPAKNIFATIRFQHVLNGHDGMVKLLREYMAKFTSYVVKSDTPDAGVDFQILGYAKSLGEKFQPLVPRFRTEMFKKQAKLDLILGSYAVIRKIIHKNLLVSSHPVDLELWQKLMAKVGLSDPSTTSEMAIKYEVPYTPTKIELQAVVDEWTANHDSKWEDVGFQIQGNSEVLWLSHSIAKSTFKLDVERDNDEVVNSQSLLAAMSKNRDLALSLTT